jgi:hypothetical protein
VLVSAEAVPYRPNLGVYVVVRDGVGPGADDALLGKALVGAYGVAGVWSFATSARFDHHGWHPGNKTITVCYLDATPLETASGLGALVLATVDDDSSPVVFAGPLETITPWRWDWFDDEP